MNCLLDCEKIKLIATLSEAKNYLLGFFPFCGADEEKEKSIALTLETLDCALELKGNLGLISDWNPTLFLPAMMRWC